MHIIKNNFYCALAIFIFLGLTLPFINTIPYLDGNIEFVQAFNFFHGGLNEYFKNWNTVHPPFKLFLAFPFYSYLGVKQLSYSLPGIILGVLGIISIYRLTKRMFGKKVASSSAILFSAYPMVIATSIFMMRDFILTTVILISILFYFEKRFLFYAVFASLAILTKETGIILTASILFVETVTVLVNKRIEIKGKILRYFSVIFPFVIYYLWKIVLSNNGKTSWSEWIFTNNENKSAIYTILHNLTTFEFINPYAFEHWSQLLFLNFNWIYILLILFSMLTAIKTFFLHKKFKLKMSDTTIIYLFIFTFTLIYLFTVLSLQTYTIPRYALPILPFILIGTALAINKIKSINLRKVTFLTIFLIEFVSLYTSLDPIALKLWGKEKILGQDIYATRHHLAGNDGITYNLQYLLVAKTRSDAILQADKEKGPVKSNDCYWIFPDPNNDSKMIEILNLKTNPNCVNTDGKL